VLVTDPEVQSKLESIEDYLAHMNRSMDEIVKLLTSIEESPDGSLLAPLHVIPEFPFPPRSEAGGRHASRVGDRGQRSRV